MNFSTVPVFLAVLLISGLYAGEHALHVSTKCVGLLDFVWKVYVAQYNKGDTVHYWGKWVGNGHRYVCYTGTSGNTNFVAVSGSEIYGKEKWTEIV